LIGECQRAIQLIDAGARITAMTLMRPAPQPTPEPEEPVGFTEPEEGEDETDPDAPARPPDEEQPSEPPPEDTTPLEATINVEGLQYPPQMMQSIRVQEVQLWQTAYDELARLGVTDVSPSPPPPAAAPQTAPASPVAHARHAPHSRR